MDDRNRKRVQRGERVMRAAVLIAVLGTCVWSFAQDRATSQNTPSGQGQSGQGQSGQGQSGQAQSGQAAGQAQAAPAGKRPPQAKTQAEFDDFKALAALTDPAAVEKAANDFVAKYPDSELRVTVYKAAMQRYQQANNGEKMMDMAQKSLSYDPDDPEALIAVAQVLAERTRDTDLDKDQRLAESKKDAERALTTIDTDLPTTGVAPEQLAAYKGYLRSNAYSVLGALASDAKSWPEAENDLRKSIDAYPQQLDSVAVLRLAVALDMQNKFPEALKYANQAVDLTKDHADSPAGKAARAEQDRLTKLNSGTAPGQSAPAKN
jgi:tetratricopeptide (TPR) repeat protein